MIPIPLLLAQTRELLATDLSASIEDGNTVHAVCIGKDGKIGNYAVTGTFLGWLVEAAQQGLDRDCLTREEGDHIREQMAEATAAVKAVAKAKTGSLPNSGCSHPGCQCPSCQILILRDLLATATEERDQARDLHRTQAYFEKEALVQRLETADHARLTAQIELEAAKTMKQELEDLIRHCWVHAGYPDCGSLHMTSRLRDLYHAAIGGSLE